MKKRALRRNIILGAIGVLGFVVAFGGIYFYKNQFSVKAKIEKCADYGYTIYYKKKVKSYKGNQFSYEGDKQKKALNEALNFIANKSELKLRTSSLENVIKKFLPKLPPVLVAAFQILRKLQKIITLKLFYLAMVSGPVIKGFQHLSGGISLEVIL